MSDQPANPSTRQRRRANARAQRLALAERRQTLFELIVSGHSYAAVARQAGLSLATLRREVGAAIGERRLDAPERYVRLQMARVEKALQVADAAIERGEVKAVSQYLTTLAALDRYHGLAAALASPLPPPPAAPPLPAPAPTLALTHAVAALEADPPARERSRNGA